tara:strand:- start:186 stop:350 length:165 start_codon:yes stop_codon:yes gene_type:complete
MSIKELLLKGIKKDPLDIMELYTKKIINREKQKNYLKKHPELWHRKKQKSKSKK